MNNLYELEQGSNSQNVVLIVLTIALVIIALALVILLIAKYFKKKNTPTKTYQSDFETPNRAWLKRNIMFYEQKNEELEQRLLKIAGLTREQAKKAYLDSLDLSLTEQAKKLIDDKKQDIAENVDEYAKNILFEVIDKIARHDDIQHTGITSIKIKKNIDPGHIIGRGGKNIAVLSETLGVDIKYIDELKELRFFSHDYKKKAVAKLTIEQVQKKNFDPSTIKEAHNYVIANFGSLLAKEGKDIVEKELKISSIEPEFYPYIGLLQYRTSFGQSQLKHSIEVANTCYDLAERFGCNADKARKIGLLHDIGKVMDTDSDEHDKLGAEFVAKHWKDADAYNAIACHHGNDKINNIYSWFVKIADSLSAGAPFARNQNTNSIQATTQKIEEICRSFSEVRDVLIHKTGKFVDIFVDPTILINQDNEDLLVAKINQKFKDESVDFVKTKITVKRNKKGRRY